MMATVDPFGGLTGNNRDAYAAILNMLSAYGLQSLAPTVLGYLREGYSTDTISVLLPETPEYKKRFAGNEARKRAGLPVLSPAEYLSVEDSYRQIMSSAGLPRGFYDSPDDFRKWIEADVSPQEIYQRVQVASEMVNNVDPNVRDTFEQFYSRGDMVAYALDRDRATPLLERQWKAAVAGGQGKSEGVGLTREQAEFVAASGASTEQIRAGVANAAQTARTGGFLGQLYGQQYGLDDALQETFGGSTVAAEKRRRLASQERAAFSGAAGATGASLGVRREGQL